MPRRMQQIPEVTTQACRALRVALDSLEELRARPTLDLMFQVWLDKRMGEIDGMITILEGVADNHHPKHEQVPGR